MPMDDTLSSSAAVPAAAADVALALAARALAARGWPIDNKLGTELGLDWTNNNGLHGLRLLGRDRQLAMLLTLEPDICLRKR